MWGVHDRVIQASNEAKALLSQTNLRKEKIRILQCARTFRPRTSGPVGPEPDYSIRLARIGGKFSFQKEMQHLVWLLHKYREPGAPPGFKDCLHNHLELIHLSDEGVTAWTLYAIENGYRFDGEYGYYRPSKAKIGNLRKGDFKVAKEQGLVPVGKRSLDAALRRSSIRRSRRKDPVRKGSRALPLEIHEPLVVRPSKTCSFLRKGWRKNSPDVPWSVYRRVQVVEPVLVLTLCKSRTSVPALVRLAIDKIYSVAIRRYNPVIRNLRDHRAMVIGEPVKLPPPIFASRRDDILRYLSEIESGGFKDTWRWFTLNHELETKFPRFRADS